MLSLSLIAPTWKSNPLDLLSDLAGWRKVRLLCDNQKVLEQSLFDMSVKGEQFFECNEELFFKNQQLNNVV